VDHIVAQRGHLLIAMVTDYLGPHYEGMQATVPADLDLVEAVGTFARYYRRLCDDPDALRHLSFEISLQDLALREPELRPKLAEAIRTHEERLTALFTDRPHNDAPVTRRQAQRLAIALRGLLVGLSQGVILGLTGSISEQYFAATARALITPEVLGPP
jgi:hypothetical protein